MQYQDQIGQASKYLLQPVESSSYMIRSSAQSSSTISKVPGDHKSSLDTIHIAQSSSTISTVPGDYKSSLDTIHIATPRVTSRAPKRAATGLSTRSPRMKLVADENTRASALHTGTDRLRSDVASNL